MQLTGENRIATARWVNILKFTKNVLMKKLRLMLNDPPTRIRPHCVRLAGISRSPLSQINVFWKKSQILAAKAKINYKEKAKSIQFF